MSILSTKGLVKTYPGVIALNDVSVDFHEGEIHALVGENGAGKSTLVKILSGAIVPDQGTICLEGKEYTQMTPKESQNLGIEIIYQEFNLVPSLSVTENIFLGAFEGNGVFVDFKKMRRRVEELFKEMQVSISPTALVEDLSVAEQQLVEIAKSLLKSAKILIMDEPTAPLTLNETQILFNLIHRLKEKGVTIIYISHRFSEIFELSDRVTVMRDGCKIATLNTNETSREEMIRLMVGRNLSETYPARGNVRGEKVLEVSHLSGPGAQDISFELHKGEILGVAGLVGAGRTELMRIIFGAERATAGEIRIHDQVVEIDSPEKAVQLGIGYVPEDRKQHGVLLELPIRENITLPILKRISRNTFVNRKKETKILETYKDSLSIKTPSLMQLVKNLSGGNQQKVVLSKWLASETEILIFDEPTRGIDVAAKQEIYQLMNRLAEEGKALIMVSSEMEELLGMSDRIIVLHEGTYSGQISSRAEFSQGKVLALASGK